MRVGPKMYMVLEYVEDYPGCPKLHPAEYAGPHGSRKYGYNTVNRCIERGLVRAEGDDTGYRLYLTEAGLAILREE